MQVDELKALIKELHTNGIEVILDVVFHWLDIITEVIINSRLKLVWEVGTSKPNLTKTFPIIKLLLCCSNNTKRCR